MDNAWQKMMFKMSTATLHTSWQTTTPLTNRCCDVIMMSSLGTALPNKQEKHLPACMLDPLRWSMPKITKSDSKLSEIYEQNEWHLCSGQCNLRFLSTKVLQSSVATRVNYGRIFIDSFTANLLQSVMVKAFWKSVSISQSYRQNKVALFSGYGVVFSLVLTLGSILPRVKNNNNTGNVNNNT